MKAKELIKILKKQKNSLICTGDRTLTEITVRFQQSSTGQWYIIISGEKPKSDNENLQEQVDKKID